MKKILDFAVAAFAAMALLSCEKDGGKAGYAAPEMNWAANPGFSVVELAGSMDVNISVRAEAGIGAFVVKVDSPVLSPVISELTSDNSSDMDLIADSKLIASLDALTGGLLPTGEKLAGKTEVDFDLSSFVPMILLFSPDKGSDHVFTLELKDNAGQELKRTLTFHYPGENSVSFTEVDLWHNTASVNAVFSDKATAPSVYFGVKGKELHEIASTDDGKYLVAPKYEKSVNAAGLDVYSALEGTGIYAGKTYVAELRDGDEVLASCEYEAPEGDVIPNGEMDGWSFRQWIDGSDKAWNITYPNPAGEKFWDSGNNAFLEQYNDDGTAKLFTPLCMQGETAGTAQLSARMVLGFVFAPGNMYTGDFEYSGFSGTAHFGKEYAWTARPSAMRVRFKASVGVIDKLGSNDPEKDMWTEKQDISRIYAAVVDWNAQHGVSSGMSAPSGMWDPCSQDSVEEGAIIGYASLDITASTEDYVTVEIPFFWYDTDIKPGEGNYSIVISCATSNRGDYLTGCSTNTMCIDSFGWVY